MVTQPYHLRRALAFFVRHGIAARPHFIADSRIFAGGAESARSLGALSLALSLAFSACSPSSPRVPQAAARPGASASAASRVDLPPPSPESTAKVDELVAKHVAARGGLDKLRALKSIRLTGTARFSEDDFTIEASYGLAQKRPWELVRFGIALRRQAVQFGAAGIGQAQ